MATDSHASQLQCLAKAIPRATPGMQYKARIATVLGLTRLQARLGWWFWPLLLAATLLTSCALAALLRLAGYLPGMFSENAYQFAFLALLMLGQYLFAMVTGHIFPSMGPPLPNVHAEPEKFMDFMLLLALFSGIFSAAWVLWTPAITWLP